MTDLTWELGPLQVTLPAGWKLDVRLSQQLPLPVPPGRTTQEEFGRWLFGKQARLFVFCWMPRPPRPGGPLVSSKEWPATVAGQSVKVLQTTQFLGIAQEVLVTHLRLADPEGTGLIYASGLLRGDFMAILGRLTINGLER